METSAKHGADGPRVGLFVTCLVDLFRPSVGFAAARLLEEAGCRVETPMAQLCCGRPAVSADDRQEARAMAEQAVAAFEGYDYVVAPSGSCASMLRQHYPLLFRGDAEWEERVRAFSENVYELTSFLVGICGVFASAVSLDATAIYLDDGTGSPGTGNTQQARALLASVAGLQLIDIDRGCAGRNAPGMADAIAAAGADLLLANDLGRLLELTATLRRKGSPTRLCHVAEILAGLDDTPPGGG